MFWRGCPRSEFLHFSTRFCYCGLESWEPVARKLVHSQIRLSEEMDEEKEKEKGISTGYHLRAEKSLWSSAFY